MMTPQEVYLKVDNFAIGYGDIGAAISDVVHSLSNNYFNSDDHRRGFIYVFLRIVLKHEDVDDLFLAALSNAWEIRRVVMMKVKSHVDSHREEELNSVLNQVHARGYSEDLAREIFDYVFD